MLGSSQHLELHCQQLTTVLQGSLRYRAGPRTEVDGQGGACRLLWQRVQGHRRVVRPLHQLPVESTQAILGHTLAVWFAQGVWVRNVGGIGRCPVAGSAHASGAPCKGCSEVLDAEQFQDVLRKCSKRHRQAQAQAAPVGDVLRGAIAGEGDERARQRLRRRLRQLVRHIQPALVRARVLWRISANYEVSAPVWNVYVHIAASPGSTWHLHDGRCDSQVESGGHCRTI